MSYSRRDNDAMRRIVRFLREKGINVWVDNEKLIPGTPIWEEEIERAIKSASAVIVVMSPDSKNSEWVRREISLAEQNQKRIFPVLVRGDEDSAITLRLITRQYVDMRQNEKLSLNSLGVALRIYLEELEAQQTTEKPSQAKTEREMAADKSNEETKHTIAQAHSERFYRIWWSALTKPTEANYQKLIEDSFASQRKAYWWIFAGGVIYLTVSFLGNYYLVFILLAPFSVITGLIQAVDTIYDPIFTEELNNLDRSAAIQTLLALTLDHIKGQFELISNLLKITRVSSLLGVISASVVGSSLIVVLMMIHTFMTMRAAKAKGGRGDFTKLIYLLSAFTAPSIIGVSVIASLMPQLSTVLFLGGLLYLLIHGIKATKVVNKLTWRSAITSNLAFPLISLILLILPVLVVVLDKILFNPLLGNTRP